MARVCTIKLPRATGLHSSMHSGTLATTEPPWFCRHQEVATSTRIPPTLRELLASRGLNMISAGVLAGVDTATISRICSGQARATPQTVVRLARALGVNARRMARLCDQAWRDRETANHRHHDRDALRQRGHRRHGRSRDDARRPGRQAVRLRPRSRPDPRPGRTHRASGDQQQGRSLRPRPASGTSCGCPGCASRPDSLSPLLRRMPDLDELADRVADRVLARFARLFGAKAGDGSAGQAR